MWIKWEKGLIRKPEIMRIAKRLGVTKHHAAACCMIVWEWAEDITVDGHIRDMGTSDVSDAVDIPGIGEAMEACDWLLDGGDCIAFPNWDRHNGEPAKQRAMDAFRKRVARAEDRKRILAEQMSGKCPENVGQKQDVSTVE
jgi:hypothetical protein